MSSSGHSGLRRGAQGSGCDGEDDDAHHGDGALPMAVNFEERSYSSKTLELRIPAISRGLGLRELGARDEGGRVNCKLLFVPRDQARIRNPQIVMFS